MAFGKRGITQPEPARSPPAAFDLGAASEGAEGGAKFRIPKIVGQLAKIALTIGFFTLCFNAFPLFMTYVFVPAYDAANEPSDMNLDVTSVFGAGRVNADEATVNASCVTKSDRKSYAALTHDTGTVPGMPVPIQYRTSIERATYYLSCAMAMKSERFCDSFYRTQLAGNLQTYFAAKRYYIQTLLNMEAQRPFMAPLGGVTAERAKSDAIVWSDFVKHVTEVNAGSAGPDFAISSVVHPKIAAGLQNLVRRGQFSADDFGWFRSPPEEIAAILTIPVTEQDCK